MVFIHLDDNHCNIFVILMMRNKLTFPGSGNYSSIIPPSFMWPRCLFVLFSCDPTSALFSSALMTPYYVILRPTYSPFGIKVTLWTFAAVRQLYRLIISVCDKEKHCTGSAPGNEAPGTLSPPSGIDRFALAPDAVTTPHPLHMHPSCSSEAAGRPEPWS